MVSAVRRLHATHLLTVVPGGLWIRVVSVKKSDRISSLVTRQFPIKLAGLEPDILLVATEAVDRIVAPSEANSVPAIPTELTW